MAKRPVHGEFGELFLDARVKILEENRFTLAPTSNLVYVSHYVISTDSSNY